MEKEQQDGKKEGMLHKRGSRMRNWSSRFIMLNGPTLSYKLKSDAKEVRGAFDLTTGCIVTEVNEETMGIKGKKIFSFWIVWPQDKHGKDKPEDDNKTTSGSSVSNHSSNTNQDGNNQLASPEESEDENEPSQQHKPKDLKQIVESEVLTHKKQQQQVEEQIERHQAYDRNLSVGMKVAALSLGGVVIGALTAGVGLVPYITVVGLAAVAGGGAVALQFRKPSDSRLILAAESMQEAIDWKTAIERQIARLEENRKPMLPPSANAQAISSIIGMSSPSGGGTWKCIQICEGMRLLEQTDPADLTRCMKAQVVVKSTPVSAFLSLMEGTHFWPKFGSFKVVKSWDDHADIVGIVVKSDCPPTLRRKKRTVLRRLCLSRFWKLDDDGIYLVTLNSTTHEDFPTAVMTFPTPNSGNGMNSNSMKQQLSDLHAMSNPMLSSPLSSNGGNDAARKIKKRKSVSIKQGETMASLSMDATSPSSSGNAGNNTATTNANNNANSNNTKRIIDSSVSVDAVITIAPRRDHVEYDDDLAEALVTVTVQTSSGGHWYPGELDTFLRNFLTHHLLEMKHVLNHTRYGLDERGMSDSSPHNAGENGLIGTENYTHFNSSGPGLGSGSGSYSPTNVNTSPHTSNHQQEHLQSQHNVGPPSPTQLLRPRSAFQILTQNPPSEDSFPSSSSSSSSSAMSKMLSHTRSSPMIVGPSGPTMTLAGGRGNSSNASPVRAKSPLSGFGSSSSGGEGLSGSGNGGTTLEQPPTSSNRVKGLIRRLGVGSSSRHIPKETTFADGDVSTWRSVSPAQPNPHGTMDPISSIDPQQVSHAVAAKRKMSLRKSLISMSPFGHKPSPSSSSSSGTTNSAPDAATSSTGLISPTDHRLRESRSLSPIPRGVLTSPPTTANLSNNISASTSGSTATMTTSEGGNAAGGTTSTLKRKGRLFKEESSALRGQIAAKEYEVQRISKDLERKLEKAQLLTLSTVVTPPPSLPASATITMTTTPTHATLVPTVSMSSSSMAAAAAAANAASRPSVADFPSGLKILKTEIGDASYNLQEQTADLGQLKAKYLALTGLSYEQSGRRKGALSRLRAFGGGGSSSGNRSTTTDAGNNNNNNANNNSSNSFGSVGNRQPFQPHGSSSGATINSLGTGSPKRSNHLAGYPRGGKLPSHWLPTRIERLDHHISHNTEADVVVNLMVVSMFAFCLICTIFLANLISLIK